ncbi:MAG: anaerobic ribonucleoside-triphosphate reductase activating protein [Methanobacterium sp.]|nr:anaerobic ribonucleoside-triphosphate reductase activating protein [Methanobacterium sp.]
MIIGGMLVSTVEYPGYISLVIFTGGCLLRCPYCHNPELITGGEQVNIQEIKEEIDDSQEFIDSLVLTGGEPLIQYDELEEIVKYAKVSGLKVKLDTNGCYPERLKKIIKYIDYVALDIKAPFNLYEKIIGAAIGEKVENSMKIVNNSLNTFLECRTTYVPGLLNKEHILNISKNITCNLYTIQQFRNRVVLDDKLKQTPNPTRNELMDIALDVKPYVNKLIIKTSEFGNEIINK